VSVTDDVRAAQPHGGERPSRPSGDSGFERTPPQDIAAEQCVLGGMLLSKDAIADVVEIVRTVDFYRPAHATIFDAVLDLYGRGEPADPITVAAALADAGNLARIGGVPYLHDLVAIVPTAANASYYGRIVAERAVLRRLVEAGTRIVQLGYGAAGNGGRDVDDTVDLAQQEIYNVTEKRVSEDFAVLAELLQPTLDEIEAVGAQGGVMTGVPTGFTDLDRLLNGLHAGQLIIVAGRPGLGKCLSGETLVTDAATGHAISIADFVRRGRAGDRLAVHTLGDNWQFEPVAPSDFVPNGCRPVLRLTTRSGRTIRATANHPFRLVSGWRPLAELDTGDYVAIAAGFAPYRGSGGPSMADDDPMPPETWDLIVLEKGHLSWEEISSRCGRPLRYDWRVGRGSVSRARLAELAKAVDSQRLRDLATSPVTWDRVVSVEPDGRADVFDLTVDGTHNFLAGGFVVHNSTAGMDFVRSASVRNNLASAIFSLEMSKVEIVMRLLAAEARVPLHVLRSGQLSDDDWTKLARRMGEISEAPLFVDDTPNMTLMEIRAKARRLRQRNDLKLIVVDYLQLMSSPKRTESRQQEVAELSRGLKLLAKEIECPVVAVSQLNRGPEQRTDKRPQLSDLRESGCLPAGTRILRCDTNTEVSLGELFTSGARDIPVWALDEKLRYVPARMTHVFHSGRKDVFRVRLRSGRTIDATANHPFLTYTGWRPIGELAVGARIAVPRHIPPPDRLRAGAAADVSALARAATATRPAGVPPAVFALPKAQVARFLRHLWDTDLAVLDGSDDRAGVIRLRSASPRLLHDVSLLLLRFGIAARIDGGALDIVERDDQVRFLRQMGPCRGGAGSAYPRLMRSLDGRRANRGLDGVRAGVWSSVRRALVGHAGEPGHGGEQGHGGEPGHGGGGPRPAAVATATRSAPPLARVAEVLDDVRMELVATNDVRWDAVAAIEHLGVDDVYDATVDAFHNFIADGVVTHNSIEQDADVVILLHRDDYYDKESPRAGEADFIVAKHRNGPTDTITVAAQLHLSRFVDMAIS
jgi:replicative DNA helicase